MKLTIEIEMSNAAFNEEGWNMETASILSNYADKLREDVVDQYGGVALYDHNGNQVGRAWMDWSK